MVSSSRESIFVNRDRAGVPESGSARNGTAIGDSGPGVAGLPPVAAAPPAACVPPAAADGQGILLRLWYSRAHSQARIAAAHYRCSKAGHRFGSDRGSPKDGSTLLSKRVMAQIRSPARVSTYKPVAWRIPAGTRRYAPNAGWPLARVGTTSNLRPAPNWRAQ